MYLKNKHLFILIVIISTLTSACQKGDVFPSYPPKYHYILKYIVTLNEFGNLESMTPVPESEAISINIETISRFGYFEFNSEYPTETREIEIFKGNDLIYRGYARFFDDSSYPPSWIKYELEGDFGTVYFSLRGYVADDWPQFELLTLSIGGSTTGNHLSGLYEFTYD